MTLTTEIATLLTQAGHEHHIYEQTVLKGVYDEDWPTWYADYLMQNGLETLLNQPVTTEQLSQFLSAGYVVYQREGVTQSWADYTAEQLADQG
jgi:hypothetical protein